MYTHTHTPGGRHREARSNRAHAGNISQKLLLNGSKNKAIKLPKFGLIDPAELLWACYYKKF